MQSCLTDDSRRVYPVVSQLHSEGAVINHVQGLLLPEEAEELVRMGNGEFRPSTVVGGSSGESVGRTSKTAFLPKASTDFVQCIESRLATLASHPVSHLEPLQLTEYRSSQQYRPHHDYFPNVENGEGRQRTTTVFAYLKSEGMEDGSCGGATAFSWLNGEGGEPLRVYPKQGDAVMWSNRTLTGEVNPKTLHGGEPVTCDHGHKVGLNAWFRDGPWT